MSLVNFYIEEKFNPVPITFLKKKNILKHFNKRKNLLEKHLKIPLFLLKDKEILEFGCNGGENACLMALHGANIYLVEPNVKMHKLIKSNFKKIGKIKNLKLLSGQNLENFKTRKKFDFVIAEGFLNTLNNREKYFKKLTNYLQPKGSFILNYDDAFGGFFELMKSFLLIKLCKILKISRHSNESLKIAKKLFLNEFNKLKTSRNFNAWWKDQLVNPYAAKVWSLHELIKLSNKSNLFIYSTSPIFYNLNHFKWYKNIINSDLDYRKINSDFLKSWEQSFLKIIFGRNIKQKYKLNKLILNEIWKFINQICALIKDSNISNYKVIEPKFFLLFLSKNNKRQLSKEIKKFVYLINNEKNDKKMIKFYRSTKEFKNTWGSILHYLVLFKS